MPEGVIFWFTLYCKLCSHLGVNVNQILLFSQYIVKQEKCLNIFLNVLKGVALGITSLITI